MKRDHCYTFLVMVILLSTVSGFCGDRVAVIVDQEGVETKVTELYSAGEQGFWTCYLGASRLQLDLNKVSSIVYEGINEEARKNEWWRKTLWTINLKDGEKLSVYGAGNNDGKDVNFWKGKTSFGSFTIGESKIRKITFSDSDG